MVSCKEESHLVHDIKLSSVGPGRMTGQDVIYEPSNMDLAMKLHYLRGIYYFRTEAFEGLTTLDIKEPMFYWLNHFYMTCGRFRRTTDSGRPFIKCNDCGARFIEAKCDQTLDEWLDLKDDSLERLLVSDQVIGPELTFSPLVFLQLTRFKCGGVAVGLSWSHVLGDLFSAAEYMNMLGRFMAADNYATSRTLNLCQSHTKPKIFQSPSKVVEDPVSVKKIGPVGDHWIRITDSKMEAISFIFTSKELNHLQEKMKSKRTALFETLSAVFWQCIAKTREGSAEPKVVTVCRKDGSQQKPEGTLGNSQVISVVKADFSVTEADTDELAELLQNEAVDERKVIADAMEREHGLADFIVYGANLTFVNCEDANFYGLEIRGQRPVSVSCRIDGVGDEGVVLVLPGPRNSSKDQSDEGRIVTAILPENQVMGLRSQLRKEWSIEA